MSVTYIENGLTKADYVLLRTSAGWRIPSDGQIKTALANSMLTICAKDGDKTVGMGRIIGDGAIIFYIQDLIILPEAQGSGVGREIVQRLLDFAKQHSFEDGVVTVGLMAAKGKEGFYQKLGFRARPNEKEGAGMVLNFNLGEEMG